MRILRNLTFGQNRSASPDIGFVVEPRPHIRRNLATRLITTAAAATCVVGASSAPALAAPMQLAVGELTVHDTAPAAIAGGEPLDPAVVTSVVDALETELVVVAAPVGAQLAASVDVDPVAAAIEPVLQYVGPVLAPEMRTDVPSGRASALRPAPEDLPAGDAADDAPAVSATTVGPSSPRIAVTTRDRPDPSEPTTRSLPAPGTVTTRGSLTVPGQDPTPGDETALRSPAVGPERGDRDVAPPSERAGGVGGPGMTAALSTMLALAPMSTSRSPLSRRTSPRAPPSEDVPTPPG